MWFVIERKKVSRCFAWLAMAMVSCHELTEIIALGITYAAAGPREQTSGMLPTVAVTTVCRGQH